MNGKWQNKYLILLLSGIVLFSVTFLYAIKILSMGEALSGGDFIKVIYMSIPYFIFITVADYWFILYANRRKHIENSLYKRLLFEIVVLSAIVITTITIVNFIPYTIGNFFEYISSSNYIKSVIAALLLNLFTIAVVEIFVQNNRAQRMQQNNIRMQYQQLKGQINPHFLFNSLNVLVSLINKDSERATDYTKKLSEVYRYVLTSDQQDIIQVEDEVRFIETYIEILQIRFGAGLMYDININKEDLNRFIPPMSLQITVENAVKHNAISKSNPLKLKITSNGEYIIVENNYIPRIRVVNSTGIGLANLKEKYQLIANKDIVIETDKASVFIVKLPLL